MKNTGQGILQTEAEMQARGGERRDAQRQLQGDHLEVWLKHPWQGPNPCVSTSAGLEVGPRICISNKCSGDADAAP